VVVLTWIDAPGREKPRDEDVRVRLLARERLFERANREAPAFASSRSAANMLGESKCGKHSQAIEPFTPTSAAVRMFPMSP
jgi:hypothetical protein